MSVIRPRPPTDPIDHHPPDGVRTADGVADDRWRAWLDRAEAVRGRVSACAGSATEALLSAYGTTGSPASRRDSTLFAVLDDARRIRDSVDRVVVIGDAADRALVDLLVSTCCHPCHDELPRHQRGGRPRIRTLGPGDDDDAVQAILDSLAAHQNDRLLDAWGLVLVGPCRDAFTIDCARLFAVAHERTAPPTGAALVRVATDGDAARRLGIPPASSATPPGGGTADAGLEAGVFGGASLLPASIAGIDVVRLLEGAAAMARRFREAPAAANPACSLAVVGRWLAPQAPPRRRLLAPPRWRGLADWLAGIAPCPAPHPAARGVEHWFTTPIAVAECRRTPFADVDRSPAACPDKPSRSGVDRLDLPRCDEHAVGQLLEGLRLAAAIESALG